jgi:hypothetical protein
VACAKMKGRTMRSLQVLDNFAPTAAPSHKREDAFVILSIYIFYRLAKASYYSAEFL